MIGAPLVDKLRFRTKTLPMTAASGRSRGTLERERGTDPGAGAFERWIALATWAVRNLQKGRYVCTLTESLIAATNTRLAVWCRGCCC